MLRQDWQASASLVQPAVLARTRATFLPIFAADSSGNLTRRILGDISQAELHGLSDVDFNARLFAFHTNLASRGTAFDRFTGVEIIGVATPQPDTAYVVYRWQLPAEEPPIRGQQVTKVVRIDGVWRLDPLADFESFRKILTDPMVPIDRW
jgi:hypothetical protein